MISLKINPQKALGVCCTAMLLVSTLAAQALSPDPIPKAQMAAKAWLTVLDKDRQEFYFGESWRQASPLLRAHISRAAWDMTLKASRGHVGVMKTRKLKSSVLTHTLPGFPAGDYVVLQYNSVFGEATKALETVTPVKEKDGSWKVVKYEIDEDAR